MQLQQSKPKDGLKDSLKRHAAGIAAPDTTPIPQAALSKSTVAEPEVSSNKPPARSVLDHNVRMYFDLDPQGAPGTSNLYSYYGEYLDYLEERDLIDVSLPALSLLLRSRP